MARKKPARGRRALPPARKAAGAARKAAMGKNVIVSVIGLRINDGVVPDLMELVTEARYQRKGASWTISYQESETTGMDGTTTTIEVAGDVLTLTRFGAVNSQFVFEEGKRHLSHYDTGGGCYTVGITTNSVDIDMGEHGGNIHLGYEMAVNDGDMVYNDLVMEIREPGA
jgi:uncharacterized beta-barrel protein YwiB (DUF1934 family)